MKLALDTNILAYAEGVNGTGKKEQALAFLQRIRHHDILLPVQVLGELFNVLVRKARISPSNARSAVMIWRDTFPLIGTSPAIIVAAFDVAVDHRLSIWDATILSAASSAGCSMLLSEDMQDGFVWGGVTIANPFAEAASQHVRAILYEPPA